MAFSANLGFPRIGAKRELKKALESYWKGETSEADLQASAALIRKQNWQLQKDAGITYIPSNDFSFYDLTLDTIAMVGAIPARYKFSGDTINLATYFAMARGAQQDGIDVQAMEMTKWFDTNYHYIVPEFSSQQTFKLTSLKAVEQFVEAKSLGIHTRPVLLGPVSFLLQGKMKDHGKSALELLPALLPVYEQILAKLAAAGADWVQIDEPCLVLDLPAEATAAYKKAYTQLASAAKGIKLSLTTYFGELGENFATAVSLPVAALHVDLVRGANQLDTVLKTLPATMLLSIGVVDGRNIWINNFERSLAQIDKAITALGSDRVIIAPSCSLLHSPVDLALETKLDNELKGWMSFATQKLQEVAILTKAANDGKAAVKAALDQNAAAIHARSTSTRIHNQDVKKRAAAVSDAMLNRASPYKARADIQREAFDLPLLPTTTIGSFPQTAEVRAARAEFKAGKLSQQDYTSFLKKETEKAIRFQENIGIDVLVDGEFDRNDMVEHFGELLSGFAFTSFGWVQSYGSRCVKPPVIFGDISRPTPMTVAWSAYAQSLTKKIMKGMLTGPVTILQWSFVRDDQPRSETCKQIGLAIRDEVVDLETAGIKIIQIDEPAIREGLPLRRKDWAAYLRWAVDCFRISAAGVRNETQIHTHMCYSEFNDIIQAIAEMDADVISIETSRSQMELLDAFTNFRYPNEIGPGVYDIHAPRIPKTEEMVALLQKALDVLSPEQIWVNPDCGLKTRGWKETEAGLKSMVEAAITLRGELESASAKAVQL
jgi:5-methyltetrahydropteroyltriglutamate--homocysteine methyltransferase